MALPENRPQQMRLAEAALGGDSAAWHELFDAHAAHLANYIRWRAGGVPDLAEDAIQETWLVAVRTLHRFHAADADFLAWLRGLAANVLRNQLRSRLRYRRRVKPIPEAFDPAAPLRTDHADRIARALDALPVHYETVLRQKYLDGASVAEIAESNNQTPKAVESMLSRARDAFREQYEANP